MTELHRLQRASEDPGAALLVAKAEKIATHAQACHDVGVCFIPLCVEAVGGWEEEAQKTILKIAHLQAQRLALSAEQTARHLFQRLAVCLWRGNAGLWVSRSSSPAPSVDGVL